MVIDASQGYWYGARAESEELPRLMLEALREYRAAETAMRRRTRDSMAMNENDLLTLRYLVRADRAGNTVTPSGLARHLGLSTASMTALLDRLQRSGHVERTRNPEDARSVYITATERAHQEIQATLGHMHARLHQATEGVSPDEARAIVDFLHRVRDALDGVAADESEPVAPLRPLPRTDR